MITLQGRLNPSKEQAILLDALMRSWSACMRSAYNQLLEGADRKDLKKELAQFFTINTRYSDDAILEASSLISSLEEKEENPAGVVFGGKGLFKQLSKKHLSEKERAKKKQKWQEKRQYNLYSRGDKAKQGNLNLRIIQNDNHFCLRINIGARKWIHVPFRSSHKKFSLLQRVLLSKGKYSVRIIKRDGVYTLFITIEETIPQESYTTSNGAIGIDLNAYPAHIAWTEVNTHGNYVSSGTLTTEHLYDQRKNKRAYFAWQAVHQMVSIAKEKQKAIVLENLSFTQKRKKSSKLRRIFSNFSYSKLKEKIIIAAKREGVLVIQVHPAYTSIIGERKYGPQYNLSRHTSAAMVIARRGLGFIERLPKAYRSIDKFLVSPQCKKKAETRVHQKKKEASPFQNRLNALWKVLKVVVPTGHSTGKCNLSTLKRTLIQGFGGERGCESHGLDPPLGNGSSVERISSTKPIQACLV